MPTLDNSFVNDIIPLVDSLTSAEKIKLENAIMTPVEAYNEFDTSTLHVNLTGIRNGNIIPIIGDTFNGEAFPFNNATDCSVPVCDTDDIPMSNYKWETGLIECRTSICMRSFNDEFRRFWEGNANDFHEDLNSALIQYLVSKFRGNLNLAKWRTFYFGDKSFTGASANYYNGFNGVFTQMQALQPNNVISITQNAGADYTAQKNIGGLDIYNYLVEIMDKYQDQLWNDGGVRSFRMTKLTAKKLMNYFNRLEDKTCCGNLEILNSAGVQATKQATLDNMSFDGYPIIVVNEWDALINNNAGLNGGGANNPRLDPHRILFTYSANLLCGTENIDTVENFDIWYDKKDKKIYLEGGARLGAGVPLDNYILAI